MVCLNHAQGNACPQLRGDSIDRSRQQGACSAVVYLSFFFLKRCSLIFVADGHDWLGTSTVFSRCVESSRILDSGALSSSPNIGVLLSTFRVTFCNGVAKIGFKKENVQFIPASGFNGENLLDDAIPETGVWYQSDERHRSVVGAIDALKPPVRHHVLVYNIQSYSMMSLRTLFFACQGSSFGWPSADDGCGHVQGQERCMCGCGKDWGWHSKTEWLGRSDAKQAN